MVVVVVVGAKVVVVVVVVVVVGADVVVVVAVGASGMIAPIRPSISPNPHLSCSLSGEAATAMRSAERRSGARILGVGELCGAGAGEALWRAGQVLEGDILLQSLSTADRMGVEMSPPHIQCQHPT